MKSKKIICIVACLLIIGLAISLLPWKKKINTSLNAQQWKINDENYCEQVSISIKGTYNSYLFRKDTFKGHIYIDNYDYTYNSQPLNLSFDDGVANLVYVNEENILDINSLGFLICTSSFDELMIGVNTSEDEDSASIGWSGENGTVISGSAETRDEALRIAKSLSEKSNWLSNGNIFESENK